MSSSLDEAFEETLGLCNASGAWMVPTSSTGRAHAFNSSCSSAKKGPQIPLKDLKSTSFCASCFGWYDIKFPYGTSKCHSTMIILKVLANKASAGHLSSLDLETLENVSPALGRAVVDFKDKIRKVSESTPTALGVYGSPKAEQSKINYVSALALVGTLKLKPPTFSQGMKLAFADYQLNSAALLWSSRKVQGSPFHKAVRDLLAGYVPSTSRHRRFLLPDQPPFPQGNMKLYDWIKKLEETAFDNELKGLLDQLSSSAKELSKDPAYMDMVTVIHTISGPQRTSAGPVELAGFFEHADKFLPASLNKGRYFITRTTKLNALALEHVFGRRMHVRILAQDIPQAAAEILLTLYSDNPEGNLEEMTKAALALT